MAWKNVYNETESTFLNSYNGYYDGYVNGKVCATLQYNDTSVSPTSVKLRFKLVCTPLQNYWDEYHVLLNPETSDRTLHLLKSDYTKGWNSSTAKGKWPYYASTTFTLTKAYNAEKFTIPPFWLMNDGWDNTTTLTAQAFYNNYKAGGSRGSALRSAYGSTTVAIASSDTVAKNGTNPTLTVTDKGNNKVQFSGSLGRNGTNNTIQSAIIYYTTDESDPKDSKTRGSFTLTATSGASYSESIHITKDCTVKAYVVCEFEYNTTTASGSVDAKYYAKPNDPGKPYLVDSSFKNGRLTVKQDWGWQWTLATPYNNNDHNKVIGYHVRLYVNSINTPIISYTTGKPLSTELSTNDWVYDRTNTTFPLKSRATDHAIVPGDKIKLSVQAYSLRGDGVKLLSNETFTEQIYTVQNAGIVNVKVAGSWVEGQVWVKANNEWHEAETVNARVNSSWKESQ
jgi:hypothetical protein